MSNSDLDPDDHSSLQQGDQVFVAPPPSGWRQTFARLGAGAFFISLMAHLCFIALAIFAFYTLVTPPADPPPDFSGAGGGGGGGDGGHRIQQQARAQQRMASSMTRRTIVSSGVSDVVLPDAEPNVTTSSLPDLAAGAGSGGGSGGGSGTGNGTGIGSGSGPGMGTGKGFGQGGGKVTFFNQTTRGKRIAYVIDYSQSMAGKRIELLRAELKKSIAGLDIDKEYQLFFFAGPAWLAGDKVEMDGSRKAATVRAGNRTYKWEVDPDRSVWEPKGRPRDASWIKADPSRIADSLEAIQETPLIYGTSWEGPLEMALKLNPPPDLIFFMTDGVSGKESMEIAEKMGHRAKTKKTIINSIAMMEPDAVGPMKQLALRSGGKFSVIQKDGTVMEEKVESTSSP